MNGLWLAMIIMNGVVACDANYERVVACDANYEWVVACDDNYEWGRGFRHDDNA
jgi:hypothetical protein